MEVEVEVVSSHFEIVKQAPGHNLENTMYQPGQCAFNIFLNLKLIIYGLEKTENEIECKM